MTFNSYIFILLFLPLAVIGYFGFTHMFSHKCGKVYLFLMSLWFYGYFNWKYLIIFLLSISVNYAIVSILDKLKGDAGNQSGKASSVRKVWFMTGIVFNLGLLFVFKYFDFFMSNIGAVFGKDFVLLNLVLPLGISFFTFQQLSYVIDVYRGEAEKYGFIDYAVFISFFPQLVAGPIVLHDEFIPQLNDEKNSRVNYDNMAKGCYAFILGLGKKVLVADMLGIMVNWCYSNSESMHGIDVIIVMIMYTMQIYFDFSGYSDMASGIGLMFNIVLPVNFDSPYKESNIVDFWKKWHMTLTRFFTKYVYIPLGGNRKGKVRQYVNIFIIFLISGLWHGANWTFILWGMLHGIANLLYRLYRELCRKKNHKENKYVLWPVNFIFLNVTWLIFRADSLKQAGNMLGRLINFTDKAQYFNVSTSMIKSMDVLEYKVLYRLLIRFVDNAEMIPVMYIVLFVVIACFIAFFTKNVQKRITDFKPRVLNLLCAVVLFLYTLCSLTSQSTFLYFNF